MLSKSHGAVAPSLDGTAVTHSACGGGVVYEGPAPSDSRPRLCCTKCGDSWSIGSSGGPWAALVPRATNTETLRSDLGDFVAKCREAIAEADRPRQQFEEEWASVRESVVMPVLVAAADALGYDSVERLGGLAGLRGDGAASLRVCSPPGANNGAAGRRVAELLARPDYATRSAIIVHGFGDSRHILLESLTRGAVVALVKDFLREALWAGSRHQEPPAPDASVNPLLCTRSQDGQHRWTATGPAVVRCRACGDTWWSPALRTDEALEAE